MAKVYKFTEEGKSLIVDTTVKGGFTLLETLEAKVKEAQLRLAHLKKKISEEMEKNKNIVEFVSTEARREAERIVERAKEDAEKILQEASSQKENVLVSAYEEGYRKGVEEGLREGKEKVDQLCLQLQQLLEQMSEQRHTFLKEAEEQILQVAIAIAERIVKKAIQVDKEVAISNIREALKRIEAEEELIIKVNPDDMKVVTFYKERLKEEAKGVGELKIEADPSIQKGGCRLYTRFGFLDADIPTQFQALREKLKSG